MAPIVLGSNDLKEEMIGGLIARPTFPLPWSCLDSSTWGRRQAQGSHWTQLHTMHLCLNQKNLQGMAYHLGYLVGTVQRITNFLMVVQDSHKSGRIRTVLAPCLKSPTPQPQKKQNESKGTRVGICHSRHSRRQCKNFASCVNFSRNNAIYNRNESTKYILYWFHL